MHLTKRHYIGLGSLLVLGATLALAAATTRNDRVDTVIVPERTPIHVTLDQALSSNRNTAGDHFAATISQPIVIDGKTVIPRGSRVKGLVVDARGSGRLRGRARLQLALQNVEVGGKNYEVRTSSSHRVGGGHKKRDLAWIGGGAGGGLLIGAVAGGAKGALIGGPVGAGAGTTAALLLGKRDIKLRPETRLSFRLAQPLTIALKS
jgi:hypothetical protein